MNRSRRGFAALFLAGSLAACMAAPSATDPPPASTPHDMGAMSAEPLPSGGPKASAPAAPPAAPTAEPSASPHDMGGMGGGEPETVTVDIANFAFEPPTLTVPVGTRVVFVNADAAPHTATAGTDDEPRPDLFDTGLLAQGESFTVTFEEPGTYAYFCERHPPMVGRIVVEG